MKLLLITKVSVNWEGFKHMFNNGSLIIEHSETDHAIFNLGEKFLEK